MILDDILDDFCFDDLGPSFFNPFLLAQWFTQRDSHIFDIFASILAAVFLHEPGMTWEYFLTIRQRLSIRLFASWSSRSWDKDLVRGISFNLFDFQGCVGLNSSLVSQQPRCVAAEFQSFGRPLCLCAVVSLTRFANEVRFWEVVLNIS